MLVHKLPNWESWVAAISDLRCEERSLRSKDGYISDLLFRGHRCSSWMLESTLERMRIPLPTIDAFSTQINATKLAFESYLGASWPSEFSASELRTPPKDYEFMVYLRHHGYPTPLLDWSRSPYIAAFFAFQYPSDEATVAIYSFREYAGEGKSGWAGVSNIVGCGPSIRTHKRHYIQQAEYTYCRKKLNDVWHYSSHEDAFDEAGGSQDILRKYELPAHIRGEVLAELDAMNINAYTLYGTEEGLAEMLANREYSYGA